jgi:DNA (cytosine-5)-methyltransferase 1
MPRLTTEMVARLQGWDGADYQWEFTGLKTSRYRQIGNAFPPPVARAVGSALQRALAKHPVASDAAPLARILSTARAEHDLVYRLLRETDRHLTATEVVRRAGPDLAIHEVHRKIDLLRADFVIDEVEDGGEAAYRIVEFRAFRGQPDHARRASFAERRTKIS